MAKEIFPLKKSIRVFKERLIRVGTRIVVVIQVGNLSYLLNLLSTKPFISAAQFFDILALLHSCTLALLHSCILVFLYSRIHTFLHPPIFHIFSPNPGTLNFKTKLSKKIAPSFNKLLFHT